MVYDISQVCRCVFPGWRESTQCQILTPTQSLPRVRKASKKKKLKGKNNVSRSVQYHNLKNNSWDLEKIRSEATRIWRSKHSFYLWLVLARPRGTTVGLKTCRGEMRGRTHKTEGEMKQKTASIHHALAFHFSSFIMSQLVLEYLCLHHCPE